MAGTFYKNEYREISNKGFKHENKKEMPKSETEIKLGTAGQERYHKEGRPWEELRRRSCLKTKTDGEAHKKSSDLGWEFQ
jgi:hypothetical protein